MNAHTPTPITPEMAGWMGSRRTNRTMKISNDTPSAA
jgi:hypothetical protein